mmetsp:Transcript_22397/g.55202  ORF Transcript_22397/g.55202 Transcript_22397/m.55202 type:complete len:353 (+) Transcript_22397:2421-3479(+)
MVTVAEAVGGHLGDDVAAVHKAQTLLAVVTIEEVAVAFVTDARLGECEDALHAPSERFVESVSVDRRQRSPHAVSSDEDGLVGQPLKHLVDGLTDRHIARAIRPVLECAMEPPVDSARGVVEVLPTEGEVRAPLDEAQWHSASEDHEDAVLIADDEGAGLVAILKTTVSTRRLEAFVPCPAPPRDHISNDVGVLVGEFGAEHGEVDVPRAVESVGRLEEFRGVIPCGGEVGVAHVDEGVGDAVAIETAIRLGQAEEDQKSSHAHRQGYGEVAEVKEAHDDDDGLKDNAVQVDEELFHWVMRWASRGGLGNDGTVPAGTSEDLQKVKEDVVRDGHDGGQHQERSSGWTSHAVV